MEATNETFKELGFQQLTSEGKDTERGYTRMQCTNAVTGKREEVILMDHDTLSDHPALRAESNLEMRTDINRAFEGFTKLQRRVLHNVLIRGMSVEKATARMSKSGRWWRNWMDKEALPALRLALADYSEVTKKIDIDNGARLSYRREVVTK